MAVASGPCSGCDPEPGKQRRRGENQPTVGPPLAAARTADGAISATGPAMKQQMDRPATAALEQGGSDALLGPDEITTTGSDDDDRAMGQHRRRQESGKRQCSGLGHCSRGQAHGLQSKRTGQVVWGFRCRRRWARGLWRSPYFSCTSAPLSERDRCGAVDLPETPPPPPGRSG